jgi:CubicO group peptidase (beta-lactamase class C family)
MHPVHFSFATATALSAAMITVACSARPANVPFALMAPPSLAVDSARVIARGILEQQHLPGLAVTVSLGRVGRPVVWREGFGYADREGAVPAGPATQFRVGSVSKLLTATVLMRMAQTGQVDLDQPIARYLDSLPVPLRIVTLRQLAGHLGGVRHYRGSEFFSTTRFRNLRDAIQIFASDSLVAPPGTRYSYSSYGYNLIGAVLENVTGRTFPELARLHATEPLGLGATVPDVQGGSFASRARLYSVSADSVSTTPEDDLSGRWPSGGYLSSTDDMARLGRAILANGLLSKRSLQIMFTPQELSSGSPTAVGIGWRVSEDSAGRRYFPHGGTSTGGAAFLLVYPDYQLVVALASNAYAQWGEREALNIAAVFLNRDRP